MRKYTSVNSVPVEQKLLWPYKINKYDIDARHQIDNVSACLLPRIYTFFVLSIHLAYQQKEKKYNSDVRNQTCCALAGVFQ